LSDAIVLVRHGRTSWNAEGRFLSRTDLPLSEDGAAEVRARADAFPLQPGLLWCSPLLRARQTAELLFPQTIACLDAALREVDFGSWEGRTGGDLRAGDPAGWAARQAAPSRFRAPGGERFDEVAKRLAPLAAALRATGGVRIVVAHRTCLGVLERVLRGLALDDPAVQPLDNAAWHVLPGPLP
jgi:probable phosphoglycerate mutase